MTRERTPPQGEAEGERAPRKRARGAVSPSPAGVGHKPEGEAAEKKASRARRGRALPDAEPAVEVLEPEAVEPPRARRKAGASRPAANEVADEGSAEAGGADTEDAEAEGGDELGPEVLPAEGAAADPYADLDDDTDADVLEVSGPGLVKRQAVALPEGEWVRDEGAPEPISDDVGEVSTGGGGGGGDALYRAFVREATRVQRLSEEEERALGLKVRDHSDEKAAKKLVVHNLRLAIKMAHQYRRAWTNLMDLVQEASAGMAIAAQRWDPDQGTRFGTYAVYWIRAQLTKFLMTNGRAIHTGNTRAGRKLYFQLPRVRRKLLAEGKDASIENIAAEVKEPVEEVARVVARLDGREASLDQSVGDESGSTLGELIAGDESSPEENAAQIEVQRVISDVMQRFAAALSDERDRAIWNEHLIASEPKSLVELGDRFGVSKQRMGQLATRLKRAFRRHVIEELGPTTQLSWLFQSD